MRRMQNVRIQFVTKQKQAYLGSLQIIIELV